MQILYVKGEVVGWFTCGWRLGMELCKCCCCCVVVFYLGARELVFILFWREGDD